MKTNLKLLSVVIFSALLAGCNDTPATANYDVVPVPLSVALNPEVGDFVLDKTVSIEYAPGLESCADFLAGYIREATGLQLPTAETPETPETSPTELPATEIASAATPPETSVTSEASATPTTETPETSPNRTISLSLAPGYPSEGYSITVTARTISIQASEPAGVFYGIQTLRKSIPAAPNANPAKTTQTANSAETSKPANPASLKTVIFPAVRITDSPRIEWRGMMLDVARTFFTVQEVERFLDIMALHNLNRLHFHLTDDQGWRIEIKKYPELTANGAWRKDAEGNTTGGFYTQDELRHIVAYAAARFIEVVPEVDMPGHMVAALATYPNLGCTGGPYTITGQPGVMPDILCAGSDEVLPFLENVYAELIDIFPSKWIHIGGDEAPRSRWEVCPRCQARIAQLGLKDDAHSSAEAKLQTWMTSEIGKFLAEHNRRIIGWDEILEGGAPADAVVMSWRGVAGGIEAARKGHDVIMAPNSSLYFDYYQSADFENEPEAIGSLVTLRDVYGTVLFPAELTSEQNRRIIGVQANLWSTYIPDIARLDYMALPRMGALSEVAWSYPADRNFSAFLPRMERLAKLYKQLGYNASERLFDVTMKTASAPDKGEVLATLYAADSAEIRYTLDGTEPDANSTLYRDTLHISATTPLRAKAFMPSIGISTKVMAADFSFNKATMRPIVSFTESDPRYNVGDLVDGLQGTRDFGFGHWVGYKRTPMDVAIDLGDGDGGEGNNGTEGAGTEFSRLDVRSLHDGGSHILETTGIEVLVSDDGTNFRSVARFTPPARPYNPGKAIFSYSIPFTPQKARWVRIKMDCAGDLPESHVFYGMDPFLFVDEIQIF